MVSSHIEGRGVCVLLLADSCHLLCIDELRQVLMGQAIDASRWIRKYFVNAQDVVVSSPDYLIDHILPLWEEDPCVRRRQNLQTTMPLLEQKSLLL